MSVRRLAAFLLGIGLLGGLWTASRSGEESAAKSGDATISREEPSAAADPPRSTTPTPRARARGPTADVASESVGGSVAANSGVIVRGRVTDADGAAIGDVEVVGATPATCEELMGYPPGLTLRNQEFVAHINTRVVTRTAADGSFQLPALPPIGEEYQAPELYVAIDARPFVPVHARVSRTAPVASFVLTRERRVTGRVVDEEGRPSANFAVRMARGLLEDFPVDHTDGRFVVSALGPGAGYVVILANGGIKQVTWGEDGPPADLGDITPLPKRTIYVPASFPADLQLAASDESVQASLLFIAGNWSHQVVGRFDAASSSFVFEGAGDLAYRCDVSVSTPPPEPVPGSPSSSSPSERAAEVAHGKCTLEAARTARIPTVVIERVSAK